MANGERKVDWPFDRFSVVHAAVGALFELSAVPAPLAIGSHIAFEAVENKIKPSFRHVWPDVRPDGWQNHVGDLASFVVGYYGARVAKTDPGGRAVVTALVAFAGGLWAYELMPPKRST